MQNKVNELIDRVETVLGTKNDLNDSIKMQLRNACYCLRSHDLIGLKLITNALIEDRFKPIIELANLIHKEFNSNVVPLSQAEELFLNLGYNRFFDLYEEISTIPFWDKDASYRFQRVSQIFAVYAEMLQYKPFEGVLKWMSKFRPPMESEISGPLFKFIRNVLAHFPFFDQWDDVWVSKGLVNWYKENQSIDKFLKRFCGTKNIEYRYKIRGKNDFEYLIISFPKIYDDQKIYLKDIVNEKQGVLFSLAMMLKVLNTQIEEIK